MTFTVPMDERAFWSSRCGGKTVLLLSRCGWQDGTAGSVPTASVSSRGTGRELN